MAQLHLDSLTDKTTLRAIARALEKLPKGSGALDQAYQEATQRINGQNAGLKKLAWQVLSWITCAKRPLNSVELQHALAVEPGDIELGKDNLQNIEEAISFCAGLVTIDDESHIIRLVHYTTQEYFERTQKDWFPDAEIDITQTCVTYLSFNNFGQGCCRTDDEFEERLLSNHLYKYVAQNWGHHARKALTLCQEVTDFLECEAKVQASSQALIAVKQYSSHSNYSQNFPRQMTGLHLAAYFGVDRAMSILLEQGVKADLKDSYSRTPLSWAAGKGQEAVVKLLLAREGVDAESKDKYGLTPLWWAAENGHEAVVKLLEKGTEKSS